MELGIGEHGGFVTVEFGVFDVFRVAFHRDLRFPMSKNRKDVANMDMVPVWSSDIQSVGYESGTLYIRFHSGGTYRYLDVPEAVYRELLGASSHGRYFHAFIKGRYPYARVG